MSQSVPLQVVSDAHRVQQIDGALLEDTRAHTIDHVLAAAVLDDDRIDAVHVQEMPEHQSRWACPDDPNLGGQTHTLGVFGATPYIACVSALPVTVIS